MSLSQRAAVDDLKSGDVVYNWDERASARIQYVSTYSNIVRFYWVTGFDAGERVEMALGKFKPAYERDGGAWELVATKSDGSRRTMRLVSEFISDVSPGTEFVPGDDLVLPADEKTCRRFYAHGWCDPSGEISPQGARIRTFYSQAEAHSTGYFETLVDEQGLRFVLSMAKYEVVPAQYAGVKKVVNQAKIPQGTHSLYPPRRGDGTLLLDFKEDCGDDAERAEDALRAAGYETSYASDQRFSEGVNPRKILIEFDD